VAQAVDVAVEHAHAGAQAHGHLQRIGAYHTGTQDHHVRRRHTRHATEQQAHAALGLFEVRRTGLHGHAAGHFAHGASSGRPPPGPVMVS
jgi:hypothetical protein